MGRWPELTSRDEEEARGTLRQLHRQQQEKRKEGAKP